MFSWKKPKNKTILLRLPIFEENLRSNQAETGYHNLIKNSEETKSSLFTVFMLLVKLIGHRCTSTILMTLFPSFQQTVTSTSCSRCGRSAGTPTRVWCITCASAREARWNLGGRKLWPKRYFRSSRRDCRSLRPPGSMTYHTPRSCSTRTGFTTCWDHLPTVVQVGLSIFKCMGWLRWNCASSNPKLLSLRWQKPFQHLVIASDQSL